MTKKRPTTYKGLAPKPIVNGKPQQRPGTMKLADGTVVEERYARDYGARKKYPPKTKDPESGPAPRDKASKHRFPPPKKDPVFRDKWMKFIDNLVERDSFKEAHLEVLEVLCDSYVQYEQLQKVIRTEGMTFKSVSRFGENIRMRPEVAQLDKVKTDIHRYTKQLDLFPKKDHTSGSGGKGDASEWG